MAHVPMPVPMAFMCRRGSSACHVALFVMFAQLKLPARLVSAATVQDTSSLQQHHPVKSAAATVSNAKPRKRHAQNAQIHFSCSTINVSAHVPMAFMAMLFQQLTSARPATAWLPIAAPASLAAASNVKTRSTCNPSLAPTPTHASQLASPVSTPTLPI